MTEEQIMHIGMINSFNLITERNTIEEIVTSDMSFLAHMLKDDIDVNLLKLMINYFEAYEMFEHCSELMDYVNLNYNNDGERIQYGCNCPQPVITNYGSKMFCGKCTKRLIK